MWLIGRLPGLRPLELGARLRPTGRRELCRADPHGPAVTAVDGDVQDEVIRVWLGLLQLLYRDRHVQR